METSPARNGFLRFSTPYFVIEKTIAAKEPAIAGAIPQAANIWATPFQPHWTPSAPSAATPTPITAPTMVCLENFSFPHLVFRGVNGAYVVDTGKPILVATVKKVDDATKAHAMPSISTAGSSVKKSTLMILFRIVSATRALFLSGGFL